MRKINIRLIAMSAALLAGLSSCNDIVTYNDNYDDGMTSTGTPVINMVYDADDTEKTAPIVSAAFEDMVVLSGENLSHVTRVAFNDVEVPLSEVYATAKNVYLPIPRRVPEEVTNKIYYETELGSTSYDFTVVIPEVEVEGLFNEFCEPGDTVQMVGNFFDLYGFDGSVETSKITMNGEALKVDSVSERYFSVVIPENAQPNSIINIDYEGVNGHVNRQVAYRNEDALLFDLSQPDGISNVDYITDGSNAGDPEPLNGPFVRIEGSFDAWQWTEWLKGNVIFPSEDVAANPSDYTFKFEVCSATATPFYDSDGYGYLFQFNSADNSAFPWNPSEISSFNTYGEWRTVTLDFGTAAPKQTSVTTDFNFIMQPNSAWTVDHSFANFRVERKLQ